MTRSIFHLTSGYKSLAPIYFRNANAAIIVYDITQPPEVSRSFRLPVDA